MKKLVYQFHEGRKEMKLLLGGKGANLSEMTNIGLPVPPGFIISTDACKLYNEQSSRLSNELFTEVLTHMTQLEKKTGKQFGSAKNPLLVSVRSGAPISMPGMMDTILNLGLNDRAVQGLIQLTNDARSSLDSYRRFIQMFGDVVFGIPSQLFEDTLSLIKKKKGYLLDTELTPEDLENLILHYQSIYLKETRRSFPQEPKQQLKLAIQAVFDSWMNPRAVIYRRLHEINSNFGTAVNIQAMVFGNTGKTSGTGIAFTRNPSTGEKAIFGEFLWNAQGEDVVSGIRTPEKIDKLKEQMPNVYKKLISTCEQLENHYNDMQDIEFTIEKGNLFILQTRNGKRTAKAAIQIATDLVHEGKISKDEAIMRIKPKELNQLLHPTFDPEALANGKVIASGLPASPGARSGKIYFEASQAVTRAEHGTKVILVRNETSPEDIEGMAKSEAILTAHGGMTSHAAVVARGMGKCCVAGCSEIIIDEAAKEMITANGLKLHEGDVISLDGTTGKVYLDEIKQTKAEISAAFHQLMEWGNQRKKLNIYVNADTPNDLDTALHFGAEGVGLCRTEHMFFHEDRLPYVRQMIMATSTTNRKKALAHLKSMQKEDFSQLFRIASGRPITIRLLDPPLHEFLPKDPKDIANLAKEMGLTTLEINAHLNGLTEVNPMLGHRGCRLAITYPEIYMMQTEAIIESAIAVSSESFPVQPEIMIPLIATKKELSLITADIQETAKNRLERTSITIPFKIGTMIETPRACITADKIATEAQFFSFGTNDLTQLTFGFSRDDASKFLPDYEQKEIFVNDPFTTIDQEGVGGLIEMAIIKGKITNPKLKMGICGEHGGDPASIHFFHKLGLHYVSCSPYRVPIARLAAAQAALMDQTQTTLQES
ncbi:pyruvate, phosphate dikinase [Listeria sp. PSOL-1]|uniref:pyruvate, phosphate dikinase n=1 Tax=Listeria sp. PSOL-1 TaxID=1844999 RepID=UPI0013D1F632|nr:pyruvate, phosphate dikinase [Listeria sp. PSOL-1]